MDKNEASNQWSFQAINKKHGKDSFDCGVSNLNDYLKRYARQNHDRGIAKTFVAVSPGEMKIDGYYSVSSSVIEYASLPENFKSKVPAYPVPSVLIGRLAVCRSAQGQGLGSELLADALYRAIRAAQEIGIYAIRVDAIDAKAKEFYLKHEFIPFQDREFSLFLPVQSII